jgi:hypothetical protein
MKKALLFPLIAFSLWAAEFPVPYNSEPDQSRPMPAAGAAEKIRLPPDLAIDATGNIYIAGSTMGTSKSGSDILTQKYDPAGNLVWSATFGKNRTGTRVSLSRCAAEMLTWAEASTTRIWTCAR